MEHALEVRGVDHEDRDAEPAQLRERFGLVEAVAAGDDEVGAEADDLLDVDAPVRRDVGKLVGLGRVVVGVGDLPTSRSPPPSA